MNEKTLFFHRQGFNPLRFFVLVLKKFGDSKTSSHVMPAAACEKHPDRKMKADSLRRRLSPKNCMKRKFTSSKFRDSLREWSLLFFYLRRPQTLTDLKSPQAAVLHNAFLSIPVGNLIPPCASCPRGRRRRGPLGR